MQVSYEVNGQVSYQVKDVLVKITLSIAKGNTKRGLNQSNAPIQEFGKNTVIDEYCSYTNNEIDQEEEYRPKKLEIDFNESSVWRIWINIETITQPGIYTEASKNFKIKPNANYGIVFKGNVDEIMYHESNRFVYYVYLKDTTKTISKTTFEINISMFKM